MTCQGKSEKRKSEFAAQLRDYGNLGIEFFSAIFIGSFGGYLLDVWLEVQPIYMVVGVLLGAAAGFRNLYDAICRLEQKRGDKKESDS